MSDFLDRDGLTENQFRRVCNAERAVIDARRAGNQQALESAQRFLGDVQFEVWQEKRSNA